MGDERKAVLVTTESRGVFFGYLEEGQDESSRELVLCQCRNAIYWAGKKGFLGLASDGPDEGSRIGVTATRVRLHGVTSLTECTAAAAKKWSEWS